MNAMAMGKMQRPVSQLLRCVNVNPRRGTPSYLRLPLGRTHDVAIELSGTTNVAQRAPIQCAAIALRKGYSSICSTVCTSSVNCQPRDNSATNIAGTKSAVKSESGESVQSNEWDESPDDNPQSPSGLTADGVMNASANRATRFIFLRTLPLKKHDTLAPQVETLVASIESKTRTVCRAHLQHVLDDRAAVHLHTAALAIAAFRTLAGFVRNDIKVENMIRAGFGAPLLVEPTMSEEDLLTLNDDQTLRPDFWIVRMALWFAFDKMAAVRKMTSNMVNDFGKSFETDAIDDVPGGLPRHVLRVSKFTRSGT